MSYRDRDRDRPRDRHDDRHDSSSSRKRPRSRSPTPENLKKYSATSNPFNDLNLDQKFVWGKKREKEKRDGVSRKEGRRRDYDRKRENQEELERLAKRREEREAYAAAAEEEADRQARMAEDMQMQSWLASEDDFHLDQARKRAEIRVRDNRAKPIDLLALNLKWSLPTEEWERGSRKGEQRDEGVGLDVELEEPYEIFKNLNPEETLALHEDIKMYLSLEKHQTSIDFWTALLVVSNYYISKLPQNNGQQNQLMALLKGKSYPELVQLQSSVNEKLAKGDGGEFWESLKDELRVWIAKAKLRDMHEVVLKNRLEQLRKRQRDDALKVQAELAASIRKNTTFGTADTSNVESTIQDSSNLRDDDLGEKPEKYSEIMEPRKWSKKEVDDWRDVEIVDEEQERQKLYESRRKICGSRFVPLKSKPLSAYEIATQREEAREMEAEALYAAEVARGLDEEEEVFNVEEELRGQTYGWEDKYRPRKPKYFNKVQTGYEWNKYNQTHYDTDNPPPKVVQGYKFSIFYPDLIDKRKAPMYKTIKEPGNDDTCILLFQAGPPYEDIAFRIVNREWALGKKSGFRSTFDRGVLQLHINFKRHFYRK